MPSDRAAMLVEPAGMMPSAAFDPKMPVATSETVPSPPTAITSQLIALLRCAASVASAEECRDLDLQIETSSPLRVNDATTSSGLTRLAPLMIAARCRLVRRGSSDGSPSRARRFRHASPGLQGQRSIR